MYIDIVPNRQSKPAILLRESYREDGRVKKRTLINLSMLPLHAAVALKEELAGKSRVAVDSLIKTLGSLPHGHVEVLLGLARKIGLESMIGSRPSRQRDLVMGMLIQRVLGADTKLADTRLWPTTTLGRMLDIDEAHEDELYAAMDWLLARQGRIEQKLAARHLTDGQPVYYDVSSSYYEGSHCPLAQFGYNRDQKEGKRIIVYGMLTDAVGRPVAVQVYPGNTADPTTVPDQVETLRQRFGLTTVRLVGDRGMLTDTQIETLRQHPGLGWISALKSGQIRQLVDDGVLQLSLFDQQNLAAIDSPEYPGETLVACHNPLLAQERARKRQVLLTETDEDLQRLVAEVQRRTRKPLTAAIIGQKLGARLGKHKMGKHFITEVADGHFAYQRDEAAIQAEAALDGLYILRASKHPNDLSPAEIVRGYKTLGRVEFDFRTLKSADVMIRPIHHRQPDRVRAHIFICMLATYLVWHLRAALAPLLFEDEEIGQLRQTRDPVAKAEPSASAKRKRASKQTAAGDQAHSLSTLIQALGTRAQVTYSIDRAAGQPIVYRQYTPPTPLQQRALDLLGLTPLL